MEQNVQTLTVERASDRSAGQHRPHIASTIMIGIGIVIGVACIVFGLANSAAAQGAEPSQELLEPGLIEAEEYNSGLEGIAYSDTDEAFGGYRMDDPVDAFIIDNVPASGALLGRTRDGEFVRYTVAVDEPGDYVVRLRVASGHADPGTINVDINGDAVGGVDGDTNGWFAWETRQAGVTALDAGNHVITMTWADGANVNFDWFELLPAAEPTCSVDAQEAEDAENAGRFVRVDDDRASGGAYVEVPSGTGGSWNGPNANVVEFCFGVENGGVFAIEAVVRTPTERDNSFYVSVDDGPAVEFVADVTGDNFDLDLVSESGALDPLGNSAPAALVDPMNWDLTEGDHIVRFYLRRDGAGLDSVALAPLAPFPTATATVIIEPTVVPITPVPTATPIIVPPPTPFPTTTTTPTPSATPTGGSCTSVEDLIDGEDDGEIGAANLAPFGFQVQCQGFIGNGPFGTSSGDVDFFEFTLFDDTSIDFDIQTEGFGIADYNVLYDEFGNELTRGLGGFRFDLDAGVYYLAVSSIETYPFDPFDSGSGAGAGPVGPYTFTIAQLIAPTPTPVLPPIPTPTISPFPTPTSTPTTPSYPSAPFCLSHEPDGTIFRATYVPAPFARCSGAIGDGEYGTTSGDLDYFAVFDVQAGEIIDFDIDARVLGSFLDPAITLFNQDGVEVAYNDDAGSLDSFLSYRAIEPGNYYLAVSGFPSRPGDPFDPASGQGAGSTGRYELLVNRFPYEPSCGFEDDGSIFNASEFLASETFVYSCDGLIGDGPYGISSGDFDMFRLPDLEANSQVIAKVGGTFDIGYVDPSVTLYDSGGNVIAAGSTGFAATVPFDGDYYLAVGAEGSFLFDPFDSSSGSGALGIGTFNLHVAIEPAPPVPEGCFSFEEDSAIQFANPLEVNGPVCVGFIGDGEFSEPSGDFDFFAFPSEPDQIYYVGLADQNFGDSASFIVYDEAGSEVGRSLEPVPGLGFVDTLVEGTGGNLYVAVGACCGELADPFDPGSGNGATSFYEYELFVSETSIERCNGDDDLNDSIGGSLSFQFPECVGFIGDGPQADTSGDYDFYDLGILAPNDELTVSFGTVVGASGQIVLYDENGAEIARIDDGGFLDLAIEDEGQYYLGVGACCTPKADPFDPSSGPGPGDTFWYVLTVFAFQGEAAAQQADPNSPRGPSLANDGLAGWLAQS